ncbi:MAG: heavy metal-binding domain-containing protein [Phycisphaerales bacterium]|nr:heavy metal-binding domain-containing protein [Phycisphaerales bacterium]
MDYELLIFLIPWMLPILWSGIGYMTEKSHLRRLAVREAAAADIVVTNLKTIVRPETVRQSQLVTGNVVIATDYFKTLVTTLRNLVGGEMKAAQRLMLRARREALLRLLDEARAMGATEVWNLRYQFCNVQQMSGNKGAISVEIYAYGTAVVREA